VNKAWVDGTREFIATFRSVVGDIGCELVLVEDRTDGAQPFATYELHYEQWNTILMIHQTQRSLGSREPEFRVRGGTKLNTNLGPWFQRCESSVNRFSLLSCILSCSEGIEVSWQSLLDPANVEIVATLAGTASVFAAPALIMSIDAVQGNALNIGAHSDWAQPDFELLHYDHAHLDGSRLGQSSWSLVTPQGTLELSARPEYPYCAWGGVRSVLSIPKDQLGLDLRPPFTLGDLNRAAFLLDDIPLFGGWCEDETMLHFVSFYPNKIKQRFPNITDLIVRWSIERSLGAHELIHGLIDALSSGSAS
jgi:hypothetical protein